MQTDLIRQQITEARAVEKKTGRLARSLAEAAAARGIRISEPELNNLFIFINQYIDHIPALLDRMQQIAKEQGIQEHVEPILNAAVEYFTAPEDVIPDRLGLLGLLDDAYVAHCLLQSVSDHYQAQSGFAMLSVDMTEANRIVRALIGEPHASLLDAGVSEEIETPEIENSLLGLLESEQGFRITWADPVWEESSLQSILDSQSGSWGIA